MPTVDSEPPVIQFKNIYRTYEMGDQVLNALDGVDLDISRNEYVAIVGASGSGSVLCKLVIRRRALLPSITAW